MLTPVPYGSNYAAHTTNSTTHLLTAQKHKKDQSHTKELTFQKMEGYGKTDQENGPKAEKEKTE